MHIREKITVNILRPTDKVSRNTRNEIANFIHSNLPKTTTPTIKIAIEMALKQESSFGGYVMTMYNSDEILVGATVITKTDMKGLFAENMLHYITIHPEYRKLGLGKSLLQNAGTLCDGTILVNFPEQVSARIFFSKAGFEKTPNGFIRKKLVEVIYPN